MNSQKPFIRFPYWANYLVLILLKLSCVYGVKFYSNIKCPSHLDPVPVHVNAIEGKWYKMHDEESRVTECGMFNFQQNEDGELQLTVSSSENELFTYLGSVLPRFDQYTGPVFRKFDLINRNSSFRKLYYFRGLAVWVLGFRPDDQILTLYSCGEVAVGYWIQRSHYTWVLSRQPTMDKLLFQNIQGSFADLTEMPTEQLNFC